MRKARQLLSGPYYHIVSRCVEDVIIFNAHDEFVYYRQLLSKYKICYEIELYAFCLIAESAHLILKADSVRRLSLFMQMVNQSYAQFFNKSHQRMGRLWRERFKSESIRSQRELWQKVKAIELMPMTEKLVSSPVMYPYSSLSFRLAGNVQILDSVPQFC